MRMGLRWFESLMKGGMGGCVREPACGFSLVGEDAVVAR